MVNIYSLPAILALLIKSGVLYFSLRAPIQNTKTRLFLFIALTSVAMGLVEAVGFNMVREEFFLRTKTCLAIPT
jgi:hypothetical protein